MKANERILQLFRTITFFKKSLFPIIVLFLIYCCTDAGAVVAFPGAEGYGANSIGGRGGQIIKVTNLNNSGSGSLREACSASGPRIVVFEVSGIIELQSELWILNPYITIAGQTSPGGILVTGRNTVVNTHDVIIQHMRFRVGSQSISGGADPETLDSFNILGKHWAPNEAYNIIVDHCSFGWGVDETVSITGGVLNATIQWCIVSEGLSHAGHPKGEHSKGLMVSGKYVYPDSVSLHHNYIAHNTDRNPLIYSPSDVEVDVDVVNNVVYNWQGGLSPCSQGFPKVNWVYNYAKQGTNSNSYSYEVTHYPSDPVTSLLYVYGNIGSTRLSQSDPHWNVGEEYRDILLNEGWRKLTPWPVPSITITEMSYEYALEILEDVGATKPIRDSVDARVIADFDAGTGAIIDDIVYPDDFPTFQNLPVPADNDNDGMADDWELSVGLQTNINDSALDYDSNGYTNIEEYLYYLSSGKKAEGVSGQMIGDLNTDSTIDIRDIQACVNHSLGKQNWPGSDVNEDGNVDQYDVDIIKNMVLSE